MFEEMIAEEGVTGRSTDCGTGRKDKSFIDE